MKIRDVRIRNFRTLTDASVTFDTVTTLIGPNGTGKSTILRALDWFFNGSRAGGLTERDCSFGATGDDIEVQATFADLTDSDRAELGKYVPAGVDTFTAWKRRTPDGVESLSANAKGFPGFNEVKTAPNATEKRRLYSALRTSQPDLGLPSAGSGTAVDEALAAWEAGNTDRLEDAPETLQTNFFGFNSSGKMSGLFDYVLVAADMRAGEESVDAKASIIGKILERSVDRGAADEEISKIVEESRVAQQRVYEEKFMVQLDDITTRLNAVVDTYSPGRKVTVAPSSVELRAPRTTFDVSVLDGTTETAVERQGHGFQRTLLVSALQVLAQSGTASDDGVICLAIEEPELFQHPVQALAFAKVLRSLAEDESKRIQVTYATHSPYFVEAQHFDQVRRLTRSSDESPVVSIHASSLQEVKATLAGVVSAETVCRQLDATVTNRLSIALFAARALLVEGETDEAVLYGIGDRKSVGALEARGTSIVAVGCKQNMPLAHAILTSLGIPAYALFDGDSGFEARARANGRSQGTIDSERQNQVATNRRLLAYFGLPVADFPVEQIGESAAVFSDHIETFLTANWAEWLAACETLEAEANIVLAKNHASYRTATLEAEGSVPQFLTNVLARTESA